MAVNPFLKSSEADALMHGPSMDPTKIVALLLDNLSGSDTLSFLKAASKSGVITASEEKALVAIASLADPGAIRSGSIREQQDATHIRRHDRGLEDPGDSLGGGFDWLGLA